MSHPDIFPTLTGKHNLSLHVLTDRNWSRGRSMLEVAAAAIAGGATVIQLRDKQASTRILINEGMALRELTAQHGVLLIVNDRIDVALAINADGVHVGQDDMPGELARTLLGPDRILGITAGTMEEAVAGISAGADYLGISPIYPTRTKDDAGEPVGLSLLTDISRRYSTPLVAIGGITADNATEVLRAGATGVAVITAVVAAEDITAATRQLAIRLHL
ncbi:thiamine phosphate synthase [Dictyobacter arantiisoli]|uniref:Thiamine-phosphate synthase n=1 Tax=Dictyobacter arantiisoli TaxID=2014874 RepID=A0A5A5TJH1_9CHLR|nr:thiamine phosphate synthase [Dictyobacter arantiisoli]GCF11577.1 thiamine-phosphate synthase [Dictyobacter arantiisoli]